MNNKEGTLTRYAAGAIALAVLIAALYITGLPGERRKVRADSIRIQNLRGLTHCIQGQYSTYGRLPENLDFTDAKRRSDYYSCGTPRDPITDKHYEYRRTGEMSYELCAEFELSSSEAQAERYYDDAWKHGAGRHCFDMQVTPQRRSN